MKNPLRPSLIRLHRIVPFDRGAKTAWLLAELGITHETRWLNSENMEIESPEYLQLNPWGRVPFAEIDDLRMFESGAICAYLADVYAEGGLAPALDSRLRADYQKWMYFVASTIDPIQTRVMVIEDIPAGDIQKEKLAALQADLRDALELIESTLAKDEHLVGNRFSAADICMSYHLYWLRLWPELSSVVAGFPKVLAYQERLRKRPSAVKADVFSYAG